MPQGGKRHVANLPGTRLYFAAPAGRSRGRSPGLADTEGRVSVNLGGKVQGTAIRRAMHRPGSPSGRRESVCLPAALPLPLDLLCLQPKGSPTRVVGGPHPPAPNRKGSAARPPRHSPPRWTLEASPCAATALRFEGDVLRAQSPCVRGPEPGGHHRLLRGAGSIHDASQPRTVRVPGPMCQVGCRFLDNSTGRGKPSLGREWVERGRYPWRRGNATTSPS